MVAVGRLKRQHSEQQRKRLMNFLSAGPWEWLLSFAAVKEKYPFRKIPLANRCDLRYNNYVMPV